MLHSAYERHGYRRSVHAWNAVDVMGKEGMLQHGTVIAVEHNGLIVDFGCVDQRRVLVRYGTAFSYSQRHDSLDKPWSKREEPQPGHRVEILLRVVQEGPWMWRPGTVLSSGIPGYYAQLVYVEVHLGGLIRKEVVQWQQVRPPSSFADQQSRIIKEGDFRTWSVQPLPGYLTELLPTSSKLWKAFCRKLAYHVSVISASSEGFLLLGRVDCFPCRQSELESVIRCAHDAICRRIGNGGIEWQPEWPCCLPYKLARVEEGAAGDDWVLQNVSHHILMETFTYLDTIDKTLCRPVCRGFDALISQVVSGEIWITCHRSCCEVCCGCHEHLNLYQMAASILKCATTSQTRAIILTHASSSLVTELLLFVRKCVELGIYDLRQPVLIVTAYCGIGREEYYTQCQAEFLAECLAGGCYRKLLLYQCSVEYFRPKVRISGSLYVDCGNADLYELMENRVPLVDVQRGAEWAARAMDLRPVDRSNIVEVLNEVTEFDPRVGNPYQGHEWSLQNVGALDVNNLSTLALYALSRYAPPNLFELLPFANGL